MHNHMHTSKPGRNSHGSSTSPALYPWTGSDVTPPTVDPHQPINRGRGMLPAASANRIRGGSSWFQGLIRESSSFRLGRMSTSSLYVLIPGSGFALSLRRTLCHIRCCEKPDGLRILVFEAREEGSVHGPLACRDIKEALRDDHILRPVSRGDTRLPAELLDVL